MSVVVARDKGMKSERGNASDAEVKMVTGGVESDAAGGAEETREPEADERAELGAVWDGTEDESEGADWT